MHEKSRAGYRERLTEGDIVYLAEGQGATGSPNQPIAAKKATVLSTHYQGEARHYPIVLLWDKVDKDPGKNGFASSKSPRELFTEEEIIRTIRDEVGPLGIDNRTVDELIADPVTNRELAIALAAASLRKMADDELRNPGDPEY